MEKGKERIFKAEGFIVYHQNIPKKQLRPHEHREAHLIIPLQGSVQLEALGNIHLFGPGRMIYIGRQVKHSFSSLGETGERLVIQFAEGKAFRKKQGLVAVLPTHQLLKNLVMELFVHAEEPFIPAMLELFNQILVYGLERQTKAANNALFVTHQRLLQSPSQQLHKLANRMESNLNLDLLSLAEMTGLSPRSLSRLVMGEMGISPKELYTYFRIQRACDLIFQDNLNLTGIAFECGYNSLSQFIENFKKWTGQKPSEFRK